MISVAAAEIEQLNRQHATWLIADNTLVKLLNVTLELFNARFSNTTVRLGEGVRRRRGLDRLRAVIKLPNLAGNDTILISQVLYDTVVREATRTEYDIVRALTQLLTRHVGQQLNQESQS